jgi:hypothetical protein
LLLKLYTPACFPNALWTQLQATAMAVTAKRRGSSW